MDVYMQGNGANAHVFCLASLSIPQLIISARFPCSDMGGVSATEPCFSSDTTLAKCGIKDASMGYYHVMMLFVFSGFVPSGGPRQTVVMT
ncbi:hypothetical protein L249_4634 [Ophiocordyceps polyrhachis-furcata BCC 54312]|uniref:Uncharacterized protein n=1 Tax=Ophiocordyceps polyrhachis-furcata BCC 54312 TaxID=1330021 RepID=A0A367L331_9HYPO|nr:hypothetical protein L249_4634 [Ophiocordyceps polyrhachis-furcata BCC 54312]